MSMIVEEKASAPRTARIGFRVTPQQQQLIQNDEDW
jgi:uncharacterized protein (DUF1778 family)